LASRVSESWSAELPDQFSVHFRREGVLHQVQKLTDPDYTFSTGEGGGAEGAGLNMSWAAAGPHHPGRSWSIAGSSFANMLPEHLRQRGAREGAAPPEGAAGTSDPSPHSPMRLSDMLKRKRGASGRKSSRKTSAATEASDSAQSTSAPVPATSTSPSGSKSGPATPGRRSRLSSASSLLSSLHPSRWVKTTPTSGGAEATSPPTPPTPTHQQTREKAKVWVRDQAARFLEQYFRESLGSRHPALTILRRLSAQVDHLAKKPRDGERCLREIQSILMENDISPFEVTQSGLVPSLLSYLTRPDTDASSPPQHPTTHGHQAQGREVLRMTRVRTFLQVFLGCPKAADSTEPPDPDTTPNFLMLVSKLNACVNHLEQFPIKMYDLASGPPGVRSAGSTLKFFKTHHLKCSLQRHPDCTSLKTWKGGLVKIDPLALVQAIERYLVTRGYGKPSDKDSGSEDDDMSEEEGDTLASTTRDKGAEGSQRLEFVMGEQVLPRDMTVYQAVQQLGGGPSSSGFTDDSDSDTMVRSSVFGSPGIWARIHTIYYRPAAEEGSSSSSRKGGECSGSRKGKGGKWHSKRKAPDELWNDGCPPERTNPLVNFLAARLPREYLQDPSLDVLCLLRVLHALNRYWATLYPGQRAKPLLPASEFINSKLTAKVKRQLQDPIVIMTSNLPTWLKDIGCVCPFLFPFETRQLLFYVTSFDRDRALLRLLDAAPELVQDTQERVTPDLDRKKRVISRETILKQGEQLMSELASSRSLLEIQYEGEVGTGLGPTLEFYSLISKELQRADLQLWKGATVKIGTEEMMEEEEGVAAECVEYVHSDSGLYPLPIPKNCKSTHRTKVRNKFTFLGKFMAKAVLDNRMIDLPFSQPFYQWLLGEEACFEVSDLQGIDPEIATTAVKLQGIVHKKARLEADKGLSSSERAEAISALTMDGCPVEDLGLDFTLPGYPNIELRKGGREMSVSLDNLASYVSLVSHWLLVEGVSTQMEAVREGFNSVFPLSSLGMFYPAELDQIFCGTVTTFTPWDFKMLSDSCKPAHGFTGESPAIVHLFEILAGYNQEEQRAFLQFVTGCPRLPIGSFKSLSPPLTIVKKSFDTPEVNPDDYLPSVMTCANYLKLPDYSSKAIMVEKLRVAAAEGQYCFHLS